MKKVFITGLTLVCALFTTNAQDSDKEGFQFTTVKELKVTQVKNQSSSGTCWAFSGVGFIEAELLRIGKGEYDLSDMYVVNKSYIDKGDKFVRLHGKLNYAQGGSFHDVLYVFQHYGALPAELYRGLNYGDTIHVHGELEKTSVGFLRAIVERPNGKLTPVWKKAFKGIIETYLGEIPEKFTYRGKEYTPESFGKSLGLNFEDYVSLTSFNHEPFYSRYALEIEDNWRWGLSYNLPLDELMQVFSYSVNNGYPVAWAADVSEQGFTRDGIAVAPDVEYFKTNGSDQEHWVGLNRMERDGKIRELSTKPSKEIDVTQEMRQVAYDNYQTTDDHGMLIYGTAKDQTGKTYYIVKNSWGTESKYKGVWYASEAFIAYKTINIVVHKDAVPKAIRSKLGIK